MPRSLLTSTGIFLSVTILLTLSLHAQPQIASAGGSANVMVVVNDESRDSKAIGDYYAQKRAIPAKNVCHIKADPAEDIARADFDRTVVAPVMNCLRKNQLVEQIFYMATTMGVPLRIWGVEGVNNEGAAVDSELAVLYSDIQQGHAHALPGPVKNPLYEQTGKPFTHASFPMYLVTRLAAYDLQGAKDMIDRGLIARNRGKFVIDLSSSEYDEGNSWLHAASTLLPADRVVLDESDKVLYKETDVIGFASWGSNDRNRHERFVGFKWLPGAIATEFVSTNGRTFQRPPATWNISTWAERTKWWIGAPQTLTADYILEGASAATGHVFEPYLMATPRPQYLLPAYFSGRNLAESFYLSIPFLSWQNIVVGDPLMSLAK